MDVKLGVETSGNRRSHDWHTLDDERVDDFVCSGGICQTEITYIKTYIIEIQRNRTRINLPTGSARRRSSNEPNDGVKTSESQIDASQRTHFVVECSSFLYESHVRTAVQRLRGRQAGCRDRDKSKSERHVGSHPSYIHMYRSNICHMTHFGPENVIRWRKKRGQHKQVEEIPTAAEKNAHCASFRTIAAAKNDYFGGRGREADGSAHPE